MLCPGIVFRRSVGTWLCMKSLAVQTGVSTHVEVINWYASLILLMPVTSHSSLVVSSMPAQSSCAIFTLSSHSFALNRVIDCAL